MANRTLYSRLVALKKRVWPRPTVPPQVAARLDDFFNGLHNAIVRSGELTRDAVIRSRDLTRDSLVRARDLTRDAAVRSKDLTRDAVVRSAALTRDAAIRSRDLTRDAAIKSKDLTRDALERTADLTRDAAVRSRDLTRDAVVRSAALTRDAAVRSRDLTLDLARDAASAAPASVSPHSALRRRLTRPFTLAWNVAAAFWLLARLVPYAVTERSDQEAVRRVGRIVANSRNVAGRVRRYYGRDADVAYPPIETGRLRHLEDGGYWLSVNRLTPEKRVDVQTAAFALLPEERLVVVGGYDENADELARGLVGAAPRNVRFVGGVDDAALVELYGRCRGFLTTARDEDFGMAAVEAMASGKPVVAPAEGGYLESVADGETGVLVREVTPESVAEAVRRITAELAENPARYRDACERRAAEFSANAFAARVRALLEAERG